jgi:hypothetical protein
LKIAVECLRGWEIEWDSFFYIIISEGSGNFETFYDHSDYINGSVQVSTKKYKVQYCMPDSLNTHRKQGYHESDGNVKCR